MKLKSNLKRFASLMLSAALVLTCIPLCAAAEEAATPSDITGTEVIVLPAEEQALPPVEEAPDESASDAPDEPSHDEMLPNSEEESSSDDRHPLQAAIEEHGYVYVRTVRAVSVYASAESQERIVYAAADDASILLATAFFSGHQAVQVWFLDAEQQTICGFVPAASLDTRYLTDADVSGIADVPSCDGMTTFGQKRLFVVNGSRPEEASDEEETPADAPSQDAPHQESNLPEADESGDSEQPDAAEPPDASVHPEISSAEEIDETVPPVSLGDFISVSTDTRVFSAVDDDASEAYFSSEYQGNFVKAAAVKVVDTAEDASGMAWYQVHFLYGDSFPSGKMKWTADETVWVMAAETDETDADACTVTDFAYPKEMLRLLREMQTYTAETDGFSLKNIHGKIGSFQAGQSGLQGSSGRDAAYPQLAKSASHGTIYATPHYLESYPVYCLEHTLSGPGEGSGANKTETGPYALLDMEAFVNTAEGGGVNGVRFKAQTMHAIGWVFGLFNAGVISYGDSQKLPAHTLMATGITDAKGNLTFSGMYPHGAYYVKELSAPDGWLLNTEQYPVLLTPENMDEAEEAIAITLDAPILNRLIYTPVTITKRDIAGKETLPGALIEVYDAQGSTIYRAYTDENGQLPDIPLVPGSYTFKETYAPEGYALNVAVKTFTVTSEGKIIGETEIRDEINKIQLKKVKENGEPLPGAVFGIYDANNTLVQQQTSDDSGYLTFSKLEYGTYTIREIQAPYGYHPSTGEWQVTIDGTYQNPVQILTTVVNEDAPGWIRVIKTDALDGHPIAGVRFDIYALNEDGSTGDLVSTMLTNDDGVAMSESLLVGDYMVKEHEAPVGYVNSLWSEKVTVVMDETVERSVTNIPMQGQVRIVKTDAETGGSLAGAVFTVIRVSGLPSHGKEGCGEVVAVITTDAEGVAVTPVLTWGIYEIRETTVPDGYLDSGCVVTVSIPGNAD